MYSILGSEAGVKIAKTMMMNRFNCDEEDQGASEKLLHMMRWSRPDILNAVRELSKNMKVASEAHMKAMQCTMRYNLVIPERGLLLKPNGKWKGDQSYLFEIKGRSDADYDADTATRRSVSGSPVFLERAP
jgi:hypothetical protein